MIVKGSGKPLNHVERAVIIQLGDIGDVVLSFPVVRAVKEGFPGSRIMLVVREKAGGLARCCRWADRVIAVPDKKQPVAAESRSQLRLLRQVGNFRPDIALDLRTGTRGAFIALISGARRRIGFYSSDGRFWRNRVFTDIWFPPPDPGIHMTEYLLGIVRAFGLDASSSQPEIMVPEDEKQKAKTLLKDVGADDATRLVAVQPFSLWSYKEWGDEKYAALVRRIVDRYDVRVLITGSPGEAKRAGKIAAAAGCKGVYNIAGRTGIGTLSAVIARCCLFVGGDSAGIHIAAAVNTPTVCIFGPASSTFWAPRGEKHRVVDMGWPCMPCNLKGCDGSGISRCLETLPVDDVFSAVKYQLGIWS